MTHVIKTESMGKITSRSAGYMELDGAKKDGDCELVKVEGGISEQRGCCNLFQPQAHAQAFRCGTCKYVENY